MMNKLGGRKWAGFLIVLAVGAAIEFKAPNGLSFNMLSLLVSMYGAFALSNVSNTLLALKGQGSASTTPDVVEMGKHIEATVVAKHIDQDAQLSQILSGVALQNQALQAIMAQITQRNK
jgi:hypothetical protein